MDKKDIAEVFEEIGSLLELKGENPFRVRAYYNAARMIDGLQLDLHKLVEEERLTEIKGIGKDLAAKITELERTGKLKSFEELKATLPKGLLEMTRIPNFGPKRAKLVFDKLKIDNVGKLEAACKEGKIAKLEGFGEKSQQKILEGIQQVRQRQSAPQFLRIRCGDLVPCSEGIPKLSPRVKGTGPTPIPAR